MGTDLKKTLLLAVSLLLIASSYALGYEVSITAKTSKAEVKKGESFTYTLSVIEEGSPDKMTRIVPPDFTGFKVSSTSTQSTVQVARDKARKVTENVYRLSSDTPGEHSIPPAKLVLTDPRTGTSQEMTSNEVAVTVSEEEQGVIGGIAGDIRDIKEPKTLLDRVKLFFYVFAALAVLALVILVGFSMYMVGRRKSRPAPAATPGAGAKGPGPRQAALIELEKTLSLKADTPRFYTAVADALRRYLAAAYGISAMEATTSELVERARAASIPSDKVGEIGEFFTLADMVKFAKHTPGDEEKESFHKKAAALVREL